MAEESRICPECEGRGRITGQSKVMSMWWTTLFMTMLMSAIAVIGFTANKQGWDHGIAAHCPAEKVCEEKECPEVTCPEKRCDCLTELPNNCAVIGNGKPMCLRNKTDTLRIGVETKESTAFDPVIFYTRHELFEEVKKQEALGGQDGGS